jgi:hypothetical protein
VGQIGAALSSLLASSERAQRALERLLNATRAGRGHLYLVQGSVLRRVASSNLEGDAALDDFARRHWQQELEDLAMTAPVTLATQSSHANELCSWANPRGVQYQVRMLKAKLDTGLVPVGLVAWVGEAAPTSADCSAEAVAVATSLLELGDTTGCLESTASHS